MKSFYEHVPRSDIFITLGISVSAICYDSFSWKQHLLHTPLKILRSEYRPQEHGPLVHTIQPLLTLMPISYHNTRTLNLWEYHPRENGRGCLIRKSVPSTDDLKRKGKPSIMPSDYLIYVTRSYVMLGSYTVHSYEIWQNRVRYPYSFGISEKTNKPPCP